MFFQQLQNKVNPKVIVIKIISKVNDKPLLDKGKLTDWYLIDLNLSVKLLSRLLVLLSNLK